MLVACGIILLCLALNRVQASRLRQTSAEFTAEFAQRSPKWGNRGHIIVLFAQPGCPACEECAPKALKLARTSNAFSVHVALLPRAGSRDSERICYLSEALQMLLGPSEELLTLINADKPLSAVEDELRRKGLDDGFLSRMDSEITRRVVANVQYAKRFSVERTPSFFVDGRGPTVGCPDESSIGP